jgi:hypothetical protein
MSFTLQSPSLRKHEDFLNDLILKENFCPVLWVRNPVRAAMVPTAGDWPWGSYRAMVGQESVPAWLETDWVLGQFD